MSKTKNFILPKLRKFPLKGEFWGLKTLLICFAISFSFSLKGQENKALATFVNDSLLKHASISFTIRELSGNKTIASYNSQKSGVPASVTKLVTTATALETLGPNYRFYTMLQTDGYVDSAGWLQGNLYIYGNGDPTLGSKFYDNSDFVGEWIGELGKAGIRHINGNVIADASLYDREPVSALWLREDIGNYYAAGVFPINVFDNTTTISIKTGAKGSEAEILSTNPSVNYLFDNNLTVAACKRDDIYVLGEPYSNARNLCGTVRENQELVTVKGDISNPPFFLAMYMTERMRATGMEITGEASVSYDKAVQERTVLYTKNSPALSSIIRITNVKSNNNYAELLIKHLSLQTDKTANMASGLSYTRNYWQKKGISTSGLFMYDGSGLSPKNVICADFVVDLLSYMKLKSKYADTFYASLPVAGKSGTVESFLKGTSLEGNVRVKSGSFRNVQSFAGYITKDGKEYAFCIIVNNYNGNRKAVVQMIEKLLVNVI